MTTKVAQGGDEPEKTPQTIAERLLEVISKIPPTDEASSKVPVERAREIAATAAWRAAGISGALALPPGPIGLATVIPDLVAIWHLQRQMVADIAAVFEKTAYLGREQMIFCLFKHTASQAVRALAVNVGGRILVRRVSLRVVQRILRRLGVVVTQRLASRAISRWIPVLGALGIGGYAYYDTANVAKTTIKFFQSELAKAPKKKKRQKPPEA